MLDPDLTYDHLFLTCTEEIHSPLLPAGKAQLWNAIHQAIPPQPLVEAARLCVAERLEMSVAELQRAQASWSSAEEQRIYPQVAHDEASELAWRVIVTPWPASEPLEDVTSRLRAIARLLGFMPQMTFGVPAAREVSASLHTLIQLIETVPGWFWTLEMSRQSVDWLAEPPDSHTKAVLRWVLAEQDAVKCEPAPQPPAQPSAAVRVASPVIRELIDARDALAVLSSRPTAATQATQPDDAARRARSLAELALYRLLEAHAKTRGLFSLNARMPFHFGQHKAELDLYSGDLSVCIEVDGPHHFCGRDAYRRDRRKDALLQEHGIWIWRVLAEDVVERTDEVMARILHGVRIRGQARAMR